jgi:hypothetical protein
MDQSPPPSPNDTGDGAPFKDVVTDRNGSTSCVGDMITYTCSVPAVAHAWEIPSLNFSELITRTTATFPPINNDTSQFSIVTTADPGGNNSITTALSVNATAALDGANVTCGNGDQIVNDIQSNIIMVFGKSAVVQPLKLLS